MWKCLSDRLAVALWISVIVAGLGCRERYVSPALTYEKSNAEEIRRLLQQEAPGGSEGTVVARAEPTGFATLRGKFTLNGSPPPRTPLTVDKDLEVCAAGGMPILSESLVIGSGNGIKNVLIFLTTPLPTDDPKWLHPSYEAARDAQIPFDQKNCVFLSHVGAMWVDQKLKILNSDPVGHNTNLSSSRGAMSANVSVAANSSTLYEPGKPSPQPFPVSCSIHPWMSAWMMVCDSPYFAVTAEDGSFEIPHLPAGVPLEFRVWQESASFVQQVTVDGQAAQWKRGRFDVTLSADKEMNVVIDAAVFK